MVRKLLATSAIAALVATGALAQSTTTQPAPADPAAPKARSDSGYWRNVNTASFNSPIRTACPSMCRQGDNV